MHGVFLAHVITNCIVGDVGSDVGICDADVCVCVCACV